MSLPRAEDFVQKEEKMKKLCKIHLDFTADLSKILNIAVDVQNDFQRVLTGPICSGRLRYSLRKVL